MFRTLDDLYAAIAQVLEFPAILLARPTEQRAIVDQVLSEQRTLLVVDNLETIDDDELLVFLRQLPDPTNRARSGRLGACAATLRIHPAAAWLRWDE